MLTVLFLYTNVFLFVFNRNASFQEGITEINENDEYRNIERISFSRVSYTVLEDQVRVELQATNDGPLSVRLVTFWIMDKTTQEYAYKDTLDINMKAGDTLNLSGSSGLIFQMNNSGTSDSFTSWFVTDRGNLMPLAEEQALIVAQLAQGVGDLALVFDEFRYFDFASGQELSNYPDGNKTFDVPQNTYIAFGCYLTNLNPLKQTIIVDSHSLFWQPGRSGVSEGAWFIVNVAENGTINQTYTPVSLEYGETRMLIFASQNDLGQGSFNRVRTPNAVTTVATFLLLHGIKGISAFAQNIPFVSLYYS